MKGLESLAAQKEETLSDESGWNSKGKKEKKYYRKYLGMYSLIKPFRQIVKMYGKCTP